MQTGSNYDRQYNMINIIYRNKEKAYNILNGYIKIYSDIIFCLNNKKFNLRLNFFN